MASCFGPNSTKAVLRELLGGVVRLLVAIAATSCLLVFFGQLAMPVMVPPSLPALVGVMLVISPIWLGFFAMSSRVMTPPLPWVFQILLASAVTAAFSVWVLPDLLLWFFTTLSKFANFGLPPLD